MAHTYANVSQWKKAVVSGGTGYGDTDDAELLSTLESVSRSIDEWCARTGPEHPMSGFGPRIGTNRYDGSGGSSLDFDDDLLSITSLSLLDSTLGTSLGSAVVDTDYFLRPYDRSPYRSLEFHGEGTITAVGSGRRVSSMAGAWGYQDVRIVSASLLNEALDTSETGVDVTAGTDFALGHTLLVDTEQLYVSGIATNTLTVVRGANGTTAATHLTAAPVSVYQYPSAVVRACILATTRRRRMSEAGLTGEMGGGGLPVQVHRDTEWGIFRNLLWQFKLVSA